MRMLAVGALLAVELGGVFGAASASGEEVAPGRLQVELTVEAPAGRTVVAHLVEPGGTQETVALAEREPGAYGAVHEIGLVDLAVVFEVVGEAETSEPFSLTSLGLDPSLLIGEVPTAPEAPPPAGRRGWGWIALAAGTASLALISFWLYSAEHRGRHQA